MREWRRLCRYESLKSGCTPRLLTIFFHCGSCCQASSRRVLVDDVGLQNVVLLRSNGLVNRYGWPIADQGMRGNDDIIGLTDLLAQQAPNGAVV